MCGKFHTPLQMVRVWVVFSQKFPVFFIKKGETASQKQLWQPNLQTFFNIGFSFRNINNQIKNVDFFLFPSPARILVKIRNWQTDRQILWHHIQMGVDFFSSQNFLPPYSLCSQGDKNIHLQNVLCLFNSGNQSRIIMRTAQEPTIPSSETFLIHKFYTILLKKLQSAKCFFFAEGFRLCY